MKNELINSAKKAVKNWWVSLLIGALSLIVGIWCLVTPDSTLVALTMVFVIAFLVSGILEILFAVTNREMEGWGWSLATGILDLLLGIMLILLPLPIITVILIYFVGFWILIRSIWGIGVASDLSRLKVSGWGWLLALAILGVIFAFLFFISPIFGGSFLVFFASFAFMAYGLFRIYLAFKLKSLKNNIGEAAEIIQEIGKDIL